MMASCFPISEHAVHDVENSELANDYLVLKCPGESPSRGQDPGKRAGLNVGRDACA